MSLCKYRHIFKKEGEGVHSIRFLNIAVVDMGLTILAAFFIARKLNKKFIHVFGILIFIGIIFHRLFCVNTTINKILFGEINYPN